MKKEKYPLLAIISVFLVIFPACQKNQQQARDREAESPGQAEVRLSPESSEIAGIKTEAAEKKAFSLPVRATGVISFNQKRKACVTARVPGRIEELNVFAGEKVKTGQNLLSLYSPDFLAAQGEFLQIAQRQKRAVQEKDEEATLISEQMLNSVEARLRLMGMGKEELGALRENQRQSFLLVLRAPFDGSVIESKAVQGDYVETGSELFQIADLRTLWVLANIYEKDLSLVQPGAEAEIAVEAYPGEVFKGKLLLLSDIVDEETRTVKGRIEVPNALFRLKPGMFAGITIYPPTRSTLLVVSEKAVRKMEGKDFVFIPASGNKFEACEVKTGRNISGYVEILEGLEEGEKVVTEGSFALKSEILRKTLEGSEHD